MINYSEKSNRLKNSFSSEYYSIKLIVCYISSVRLFMPTVNYRRIIDCEYDASNQRLKEL